MDSHLPQTQPRLTSIESGRPTAPSTESGKPISAVAVSNCAQELGQAIRTSLMESFRQWEVTLVPEMSRALRGFALRPRAKPDSAPQRVEPGATAQRLPVAAPPAPLPRAADDASGREPQEEPSWDSLAQAVQELRLEWDRQSFEELFPDQSVRSAEPKQVEEYGGFPGGTACGAGGTSTERPVEAGSDAAPDGLTRKLDELIRLVRGSLTDKPAPPAPAPGRIDTREIAREVAGQLRETIAGYAPVAGRPESPAAPPAPPKRIPISDVGSIIDQITGGGRS